MTRLCSCVALTFFLAITLTVEGVVEPNNLFTENAVLQQGKPISVWGTAKAKEEVTVEFAGQTASAKAGKNGEWSVTLKEIKAGGPFTMVIRGENTITLTNVLVGEVWLASGQSNMQLALWNTANGQDTIRQAADPNLHLITVHPEATDKPKKNFNGSWEACSPQTVSNFSAVAYYFGRELRTKLGVPVGMINSSLGATCGETWTPPATLKEPMFKIIRDSQAAAIKNWDPVKAKKESDAKIAKALAEGKKNDAAMLRFFAPVDPRVSVNRPGGLYNGMIAPLIPFAIKGAIWYQGESNNDRAKAYVDLFPAMVAGWRKAWGQGDFPFLYVQIAPYMGMSPRIREAQRLCLSKTPVSAMAVITDFGEAGNIHPVHKEPVGQRLALAARALAYGETVEYSGPLFKAMKADGDHVIVSFDHLGGGLDSRGEKLKGFTISAGTNFVPAEAAIEGDTVVVRSPQVPKPSAVRYGWENVPVINLFNKAGLPASPFQTGQLDGR